MSVFVTRQVKRRVFLFSCFADVATRVAALVDMSKILLPALRWCARVRHQRNIPARIHHVGTEALENNNRLCLFFLQQNVCVVLGLLAGSVTSPALLAFE